MSDVEKRAQKLLDELDSWFLSSDISAPFYVANQIAALKLALERANCAEG